MIEIFNFRNIRTFLVPQTKSLYLYLTRPFAQNKINQEMLSELLQVLNWCSEHREVVSLFISAETPYLSQGLDLEEFEDLSLNHKEFFIKQIHKVMTAFIHLPQTIVIDLKKECHGPFLEMSIVADIRISHTDLKAHWGDFPVAGGIGLLSEFIPRSYAQKWWYKGESISQEELIRSGFLHTTYEKGRLDLVESILKEQFNRDLTTRLQTKGLMYATLGEHLEILLEQNLKWCLGKITGMPQKQITESSIPINRPQ